VLGFLQNGQQIVADRYSYLPCIGLAILAGAGIARLLSIASTSLIRGTILIFTAAVVGELCILTWKQTMIWQSTTTLWTYTGTNAPNNSGAQNSYGFVLMGEGRLDEAIDCLRRAITILPTNERAHHNLWEALRRKEDDKALMAALEYSASIPTLTAKAQFQRGLYFMTHTQYDLAIEAFNDVLRLQPAHAQARTNIGWILNKQGKVVQALLAYEQAVKDDPTLFQARYNYGLMLEHTGRIPEAIVQFQEAMLIDPTHTGVRNAMARAKSTPR
jgi:protein O-mannosyl-transferase